LILAALVSASAATPVDETAKEDTSPWRFRLAPYAWLTSTSGSIGAGPLSTDAGMDSSTILSNLQIGAMFVAEVAYDRWSLENDLIYARFQSSKATPGTSFGELQGTLYELFWTSYLGYRVIQTLGEDLTAIDFHAGWGAWKVRGKCVESSWKVRRQRRSLNERIVLNQHEPTPAMTLPRGAGDDLLVVQTRRQNLHLGTLRTGQLVLGSARWRVGDVRGRARAPRIRLLAQHQHLTHIHLDAASATAVVGSPEKRPGALNAPRRRWLGGAGTRRAQVVSERMHGRRRRRGQPLPGPDEWITARIIAGQRRGPMEERWSVLGLARLRGGDSRNGRLGGQECRGRCGPCNRQ
jgi:hypothetical protein